MYYFFMGKTLLPIPPSKLQISVNNQNKTINLMNEGEVNIVKPAGLSTIKFDVLLPMYTIYPFATYFDNKFLDANYFLCYFENLKTEQEVFQFIVTRIRTKSVSGKLEVLTGTNIQVTLESYTITESTENAPDLVVSIELKQYVKYGTITKEIDLTTNTVKKNKSSTSSNKKIPNTYTVKKGDTLWGIAKKLLGDGAKCWNLAKLNGISNPNLIRVGQVLKIKDVKATTAPVSKSNTTKSSRSSTSSNTTTKSTSSYIAGSSSLPIKFTSLRDNYRKAQKTVNSNPTGTSGSKSSGYGSKAGKTSVVPISNSSSGVRSVDSGRDFSKVKRSVR